MKTELIKVPSRIIAMAIIVAGQCVWSCSGSLQTASKTTPDATLDQYRSYAWATPGKPDDKTPVDTRMFAPLIYREAAAALGKKGLELYTIQPDAVFIFHSSVQERVKYSKAAATTYSPYFEGPGYYPGFGPGVPGGEVLPQTYEEGTLAFEMYDTKTRKLIWQGWAEKTLTAKSDVQADIKQAINAIFNRLPIHHKK
jgi:hypothetical protein